MQTYNIRVITDNDNDIVSVSFSKNDDTITHEEIATINELAYDFIQDWIQGSKDNHLNFENVTFLC